MAQKTAEDPPKDLLRVEKIRTVAAIEFHEYEACSNLRGALLRKGRPWRAPFEVGQRIAYWREQRSGTSSLARRTTRDPGYEKGVILSFDGESNVWIRNLRGRLTLADRAHLPSLVSEVLWNLSADDIGELKRAR